MRLKLFIIDLKGVDMIWFPVKCAPEIVSLLKSGVIGASRRPFLSTFGGNDMVEFRKIDRFFRSGVMARTCQPVICRASHSCCGDIAVSDFATDKPLRVSHRHIEGRHKGNARAATRAMPVTIAPRLHTPSTALRAVPLPATLRSAGADIYPSGVHKT